MQFRTAVPKRQRAAALQDLSEYWVFASFAKRLGVRLPSAAFTDGPLFERFRRSLRLFTIKSDVWREAKVFGIVMAFNEG
jgi:hypothetical protein